MAEDKKHAEADCEPEIILITGNMAAGKSSLAQALAEQLPRSVHLRGDLFRRMIVNGQAEMSFELSDEAAGQLQLRYELAAIVARRYAQAGFAVVYQDILIGEGLAQAIAHFSGLRLALIVLCPHPDVLAARDAARAKTGYPSKAAIQAFDHVLRHQTPRLGYWLDNSNLTLTETVNKTFTHLHEAMI